MSTVPTPAPPIGSMYLFDCVTPPLVDGSYRIDVVTNVTYDSQQAPLSVEQRLLRYRGTPFYAARYRCRRRLSSAQRSRRLR